MERIKTTQEYFGLTVEELVGTWNEQGYTPEELKLFDDGKKVIFYDDEQEMNEYKEETERYEIKAILKTVNERIAVVLI